jgi:hypothetical protein
MKVYKLRFFNTLQYVVNICVTIRYGIYIVKPMLQ